MRGGRRTEGGGPERVGPGRCIRHAPAADDSRRKGHDFTLGGARHRCLPSQPPARIARAGGGAPGIVLPHNNALAGRLPRSDPPHPMPEPSAYLDLDDLLRTLRRRALPILGASVLAGLLATAGLVFLSKHRADATLGLASLAIDAKKTVPYGDGKAAQIVFSRGITPPEWKTLAPRFDAAAFAEFVARRGGVDPALQERIERELSIEERRRDLLAPVYGSTRSDIRELGESAKPQENAVLGIRIGYGSRDRERARNVVALVGEFIGESAFQSTVQDMVSERAREHEASRLVAQNLLVNSRFTISQLESRGRTLEKLRAAHPDLARSAPQQVVSVAEGGARYLSPTAQIVGVESTLAEFRERVAFADRQARKAAAQQDYYRKVEALLTAKPRPDALIAQMRKQVAASFPEGADPDGAIAEGRNEVLLDLVQIAALRERGLVFIAPPAIAEREPATLVKFGLAAGLATLVAGLALVLAAVWWRSGRAGTAR